MASYLHPGVYVEEIASGSRPIEGVATSTTAFVGITQRNSTHDPVLIGSVTDYTDLFGPILTTDDAMGLSVQAYYRNGGGAAYICPLSTASVTGEGLFGAMIVSALGDGPWSTFLFIKISRVSASDFDMAVGTRNSSGTFYSLESFEKVTFDATLESFAETVINGFSAYVTVTVEIPVLPGIAAIPDLTGSEGDALDNVVGAQTSPAAADFASFYADTLRKIRVVSIIVLPGQTWAADGTGNAIISETRAHCDKMKNRIVLIDVPNGHELADAGTVETMALPTSTYTALYYPWVGVSNPLFHPDKNPDVSASVDVAPSAIAAGMWAKIDAKRGVWKAPAGVEAQITGASSLQFQVENLEQDQLNPLGVNCIRKFPNYGSVIWGARSLATKADPEWRYIPVRRTAIFIEESIYNGIQWAVFEPNDVPLWSSLRANIGAFMNGLYRAGAFQGQKSSDAYFVRCGLGDTMTQADIDRGQVIALVGFAALKPAEFVIVRIQQKVGEE
ncbi:MAG: phage tail sheath protein FI [Psychromonas sp.]|jgi:phage tail sheath protein FI|uniref:phage tail sheath family protein n=1 Tax=Psychromonas sp. TaxID=1884585 RepID=UPI0039E24CFD